MTKEEYIKKLIEFRKQGYEEPKSAICNEVACSDCYFACEPCNGHEVINVLLDHIIDHETPQETNLEHYWDNLCVHFNPRQIDGYLAFIDSKMNEKEWLLAPYEEPKPKYKMSQFCYNLIKEWVFMMEVCEDNEDVLNHKLKDVKLSDALDAFDELKNDWSDISVRQLYEHAEVIDSE